MNVAVLRHELAARVNHLGYEQMLQLRGYLDSFVAPGQAPNTEQKKQRSLGDVPGRFWMSDDFDATPDCFAGYMF